MDCMLFFCFRIQFCYQLLIRQDSTKHIFLIDQYYKFPTMPGNVEFLSHDMNLFIPIF